MGRTSGMIPDLVDCGGCQSVFHPAVSCLGVSQSVLNVLLGTESSAIRYLCCVCRDRDNSPLPSGQGTGGQTATLQILTMIGSLVADVKKLSEKVEQAVLTRLGSISQGLAET